MKFEIHKATLADADDMLITMNQALGYKLELGDTAWEETPFTLEDINQAIKRDTTYVASLDGQSAGQVVLIWEDERGWGERGLDSEAGYIHGLATRNSFRGQHLGE